MMKKISAIMTSLIVLGCAYPAFAATKNIYTDADSGFSMQTTSPALEYASRYSYGFQENDSVTDSINSVAAIPADIVTKKTGIIFTTKEFKEKLSAEMSKKSGEKPDYVLFQPETYTHQKDNPYQSLEDAIFHIFVKEDFPDVTFSYDTKTVGKQNYFVISMQFPGAFDKEKGIDKNASDVKLYLTSENDILYLAESYCSAETEAAKKAKAESAGNTDTSLKKTYEEKGVSMETAGSAIQDPQALQKALLPLTNSSLNDPNFQKSLQKERDSALKGLTFFKPDKNKSFFGINDPVLKQQLPLPDNWMYAKAVPEFKELNGVKLNVAWAAPYTMVTNIASMCMAMNLTKDVKPDDVYKIYDESVILASYKLKKGKNKNTMNVVAEEIFSIPQSEMQNALNQMIPSLLNNEELKKYAALSNIKAKIANNGQLIKFSFDSNVKVMDKYDFLTRSALTGTRDKGLFSLYVAKGDKEKTKSIVNLADKVKLLPE